MAVSTSKTGRLGQSQKRFVIGGLTPIMLYMMFFTLIPMLWAVVITVFRFSPTRQGAVLGLGGLNPFIGIDNYLELLSDSPNGKLFRLAAKNTLMFAVIYVPLNLVVTLTLAALIDGVGRHFKSAFRTIYFLPTVTSLVAVSLIWGAIYNPTFGLLNMMLRGVGLSGKAWLTDSQTRILGIPLPMLALVITYLWQDMGYNLVIFLAGLQGIPEVFHEAARVDGASVWQRFRHITIPLLRPTFTFVIVMTMLSTWQVFIIFQVMTRGGPSNLTRTLVLHIYETAFRFQEQGLASAMAMVLFLFILIATVIQLKVLRQDWEY
jgi:ABC-type sugar transport system permease subunit